MSRRLLFVLCVMMLLGAMGVQGFAAPLTPVSYSFNVPTACGSWCYSDNPASYSNPGIPYPDVFTKLTDGIVGNDGWAFNQGREWDGWLLGYGNDVKIDFNFGSTMNVNSVSIGSTQDSPGDVVLPSFYIYSSNDDTNWTFDSSLVIPPSYANDVNPYSGGPPNFYTLNNLGINAQYVRVDAVSNGPWVFMDEVRFDGNTQNVPEPASLTLVLSGIAVFAGFAGRLRRHV